MDRQALQVAPREAGGKGAARRLRKSGQVPAVFYGSGIEPVHLAVDGQLLDRVLHGGANAILDLQGLDEVKGKLALVKTLQRDPLSRRVLHCDLYAVDERKKVQVAVAIHLEGKAHGVEMGGLLEPILRELDVECLPLEIPGSLSVDVSALDIGDSIHVSDISVPDGVTVLNDDSATVVHVVAPRVEEEPEAEAVEGEVPEGEAPPAEAEGEAKAESGGE